MKDKRIVFIFDECHRSQFGENHRAIKEFFPRSQLFGFTGTPIFEANASLQKIEDTQESMRTTDDLFQQQLHAYTITHAIEDGNVLRFHVDYFKPDTQISRNALASGSPDVQKPDANAFRLISTLPKRAVVEAILSNHDAATGGRRFNAILATASINDAIEYFDLFGQIQKKMAETDPEFKPLNIACVFSPPAQLAENPEAKKDIEQLSEDLPQEQEDCILVIEEPSVASFQLHSSVEQLTSLAASNSGHSVGNDSFVRFVQVGFGVDDMLVDIPNTTISLRETEVLFSTRTGKPSSFNPVQKSFRKGQGRLLVADIGYVFFEMWRHPIGIPLKITA